MENNAKVFDEIVNQRRAVRLYGKDTSFDKDAVRRSLERAVLSPSSSNMQIWEFYRVNTPEKKEELAKYCLGQPTATTAEELIVIVVRFDKWKERRDFLLDHFKKTFGDKIGKREQGVLDYYGKLIPSLYFHDIFGVFGQVKKLTASAIGLFRPITRELSKEDTRVMGHKSAALAAMTFMLSIKAEGYDTCPMEGIDSERIKSMLNLPFSAEINMVISVGKGNARGVYGDRLRVPNSEVIFEV